MTCETSDHYRPLVWNRRRGSQDEASERKPPSLSYYYFFLQPPHRTRRRAFRGGGEGGWGGDGAAEVSSCGSSDEAMHLQQKESLIRQGWRRLAAARAFWGYGVDLKSLPRGLAAAAGGLESKLRVRESGAAYRDILFIHTGVLASRMRGVHVCKAGTSARHVLLLHGGSN